MLRSKRGGKGFTMIEILITLVVLGILVSLAMVNFTKTIERAKDKEAIANLELIQHAQKMYQIETGSYYPQSGSATFNVNDINDNLRLSLRDNNWIHNINCPNWNDPVCNDYNATSDRNNQGQARTWMINSTMNEPFCTGNPCP